MKSRGAEDRIIELASRIKAVREELRKLEGEFRQVMYGTAENGASEAVSGVPGGLARKFVEFMNHDSGRDFTAEDMVKIFSMKNINTARSTLSRLATGGFIDKVERGRYRAKVVTSGVDAS